MKKSIKKYKNIQSMETGILASKLSKLVRLAAIFAMHHAISGFVLLSKNGATLDTSKGPVVFYWTGKGPEDVTDVEKYEDGKYDGLEGEELYQELMKDAFSKWNAVEGSSLRLEFVVDEAKAKKDGYDKVNSITVSSLSSASAGASALPLDYPDEETGTYRIEDCDITIGSAEMTAQYFVEAMTHELGHCLGLGHAHTNYKSIMGYSRSKNNELGADDIAGLLYLYPDAATATDENGKPEVKELISPASCGVVGAENGRRSGMAILITLLGPLIAVAAVTAKRRRKNFILPMI
jgi:hypothetical protein